MNVITFQYETNYGDTLVSVFDSLDAVITRLKLMQLHDSFDECESIKIDCNFPGFPRISNDFFRFPNFP